MNTHHDAAISLLTKQAPKIIFCTRVTGSTEAWLLGILDNSQKLEATEVTIKNG